MDRCISGLAVALVALGISSLQALPPNLGDAVRGRYEGRGSAIAAGVTVRYDIRNVYVNNRGRVTGAAERRVLNGKRVVAIKTIRLRGRVQSLRLRASRFTAPTRIRMGDGAVVQGSFRGLTGPTNRLSRFFSGRVEGVQNSRVTIRSR